MASPVREGRRLRCGGCRPRRFTSPIGLTEKWGISQVGDLWNSGTKAKTALQSTLPMRSCLSLSRKTGHPRRLWSRFEIRAWRAMRSSMRLTCSTEYCRRQPVCAPSSSTRSAVLYRRSLWRGWIGGSDAVCDVCRGYLVPGRRPFACACWQCHSSPMSMDPGLAAQLTSFRARATGTRSVSACPGHLGRRAPVLIPGVLVRLGVASRRLCRGRGWRSETLSARSSPSIWTRLSTELMLPVDA